MALSRLSTPLNSDIGFDGNKPRRRWSDGHPAVAAQANGARLMSDTTKLTAEWEPRVLSVVRIIVGLLFMEHGLGKLIGFPPGPPGAQAAFHLLWFAAIIESVAWIPDRCRSVHPRGGSHHVRRNGDRVTSWRTRHGLSTLRERRRCSDPVLSHLLLFLRRRRRSLESSTGCARPGPPADMRRADLARISVTRRGTCLVICPLLSQ